MKPDVEEVMRVHFPKEYRKLKFQLFMERFYLWRRFAGRWRYREPYARVYHPIKRSLRFEEFKTYPVDQYGVLGTQEDRGQPLLLDPMADARHRANIEEACGSFHARILPSEELTEEEQERIMERYANDMAKVRPQDENP